MRSRHSPTEKNRTKPDEFCTSAIEFRLCNSLAIHSLKAVFEVSTKVVRFVRPLVRPHVRPLVRPHVRPLVRPVSCPVGERPLAIWRMVESNLQIVREKIMVASFRGCAHQERCLLAILYISIHIIAIASDRPYAEFFPSAATSLGLAARADLEFNQNLARRPNSAIPCM
jgi:hypothetical protein